MSKNTPHPTLAIPLFQSAKQLRFFNVMKIDQHTVLYGVVGSPLGHTLSPVMHNTAFEVTGLNSVYLAFETRDLEGCMHAMRALCIRGMSVTLPFKSTVIPYLDELDPLAEDIGAVNTIVNDEGGLTGYNTDASGALKAIEESTSLSGRRCLLIGAGGAAHAIGFVLKERGLSIAVANRSSERGEALAGSLGCPFVPLKDLEATQADILIQTTPLGMYPGEDECIVPTGMLKEGMVVMDIIYNPIETKLLKEARSRGCKTISGLSMFVYQGAQQFKLWTGLDAPIGAMTNAVKRALTGTDIHCLAESIPDKTK